MKCPVCSSTRLSPETETGPYKTSFRSGFQVNGKLKTAQIDRGRICGDCGHVILFVGKSQLSGLQEVWDSLSPSER
jgi:DNA-directed RNA polymerase subunit RPC12/RpoP